MSGWSDRGRGKGRIRGIGERERSRNGTRKEGVGELRGSRRGAEPRASHQGVKEAERRVAEQKASGGVVGSEGLERRRASESAEVEGEGSAEGEGGLLLSLDFPFFFFSHLITKGIFAIFIFTLHQV